MTEMGVVPDALHDAAKAHLSIATLYSDLHGALGDLALPSGALGKLPESDTIQAAFDARFDGLGEALAALKEIYENIGDGLVVTADSYVRSDEESAALYATFLGEG